MGMIRVLVVVCGAVIAPGAAGFAFAANGGPPVGGLAPVGSRYLDQVFVRPGVDLGAYRRILVDPVAVEFHRNWIRNEITLRSAPHRLAPEDVRAIEQDFAASLERSLVEVFKAKGFGLATSQGPDVLRLTPAITDLYVSAPERLALGRSAMFVRDAGDAVLNLEARDAASGELLARITHRGSASGLGRLGRANDVLTRFWFDALFSRWAADCARELAQAGMRTTLSRLDESRSAGGGLQ